MRALSLRRRGVGAGPARRGGAVSRTTPPAIVRRRPDSRSTNRSPTSRTSGSAQRDPDERPVGGHLLHVVEADPRVAFGRARVQLERAARRDRTVERSDGFDARLEDGRGGPQAGGGKDLAPRDPRAFGGEVGRDPGDRRRAPDVPVVRLEPADPRPGPGRQELDLRAGRQRPAGERPRHDGARTLDREHAVDVQAGAPVALGLGGAGEHRVERDDELVEPLAGRGRARDDRSTFERGALDAFGHLGSGALEPRRVDEVALGERDHRAVRAEDVDDLEVFLGLRLPTLVRRDHEQHQADRSDAGEHRADEPLVPRHVDEPELASRGERAPRVPELDRQAPALLLVETIGVHPGQTHDQARLAVIDVAGGRDDGGSGAGRCLGRRGARAFSHRAGRRPRARSGRLAPGRASPRVTPSAGRAARRVR